MLNTQHESLRTGSHDDWPADNHSSFKGTDWRGTRKMSVTTHRASFFQSLLLPGLLTLVFWVGAVFVALQNVDGVTSGSLSAMKGMYTPGEDNWGLVALMSVLWILGYFFLLVTWGNFTEVVQARVPGWMHVFWSAVLTLLACIVVTFITPLDDPDYMDADGEAITNFTTTARWALEGFVFLGIVLFTLYIGYTAPNTSETKSQ